jgi:hypothetical protein
MTKIIRSMRSLGKKILFSAMAPIRQNQFNNSCWPPHTT